MEIYSGELIMTIIKLNIQICANGLLYGLLSTPRSLNGYGGLIRGMQCYGTLLMLMLYE